VVFHEKSKNEFTAKGGGAVKSLKVGGKKTRRSGLQLVPKQIPGKNILRKAAKPVKSKNSPRPLRLVAAQNGEWLFLNRLCQVVWLRIGEISSLAP